MRMCERDIFAHTHTHAHTHVHARVYRTHGHARTHARAHICTLFEKFTEREVECIEGLHKGQRKTTVQTSLTPSCKRVTSLAHPRAAA